VIERQPDQPIRLAGQELIRILDELNGREAPVPNPSTLHRQAREEFIAIPGLGLNLEVNGIPTRTERDGL
jgi:hypothetical protein